MAMKSKIRDQRGRAMKSPVRMLSMTVAWISGPGYAGPNGVLRISPMPIAVTPTRTILSLNVPAGSLPPMMSLMP
jgi:hypothetical protein